MLETVDKERFVWCSRTVKMGGSKRAYSNIRLLIVSNQRLLGRIYLNVVFFSLFPEPVYKLELLKIDNFPLLFLTLPRNKVEPEGFSAY